MPWPRGVPTLHSFVSNAWQPVVASVLLTQPHDVVLWYSGAAWVPFAQTLKAILTTLLPCLTVRIAQITSSNLVEAEQTLMQAVLPTIPDDNAVLFNITQGNRLMGLASLGAAQRNPNLWLIYRDLDAAPFHFTMIRYEHDSTPHTYLLDGTSASQRATAINWNELFKPLPPRPPTPCQEVIQTITIPPVRKSVTTP